MRAIVTRPSRREIALRLVVVVAVILSHAAFGAEPAHAVSLVVNSTADNSDATNQVGSTAISRIDHDRIAENGCVLDKALQFKDVFPLYQQAHRELLLSNAVLEFAR